MKKFFISNDFFRIYIDFDANSLLFCKNVLSLQTKYCI